MGAAGYLAASVPSRMASFGAAVALPILAVQQLGDVTTGGLLAAASLGPSVLAAPLAGAVLDRVSRPEFVIAGSCLLTAAVFAVAGLLGEIPLPVVFASLVAKGLVSPFYMGGLSSFVVSVVPDVPRAFAYDTLSYNLSAVAGPALVAVLTTFLPAQAVLWMLAATAALGSAFIVPAGLNRHARSSGSPYEAIKAGLQRIFSHRPLAVVTFSFAVTQVGQGALGIVAVSFSLERAGSPGEGAALVTSFAFGSLLGAMLEAARPARHRPQLVMMAGFMAAGLLTFAAVVDLGIIWINITIGLSGISTAPATAAMLVLRNRHSPAHLRSQIFTVSAGLAGTASAGGAALAASASAFAGGAMSLWAIGILWIASACLMFAYPKAGDSP